MPILDSTTAFDVVRSGRWWAISVPPVFSDQRVSQLVAELSERIPT